MILPPPTSVHLSHAPSHPWYRSKGGHTARFAKGQDFAGSREWRWDLREGIPCSVSHSGQLCAIVRRPWLWQSSSRTPTKREIAAVLRRVYAALILCGRSIIQDAFLEDFERLYPEQANLFAVRRLLWAERVIRVLRVRPVSGSRMHDL
ncbi:hypothetical protein NSPZN2_110031 [Nitrospira defluvii]|uniref:Uncharacterized protein n=1 Tax=Nitrospira defluvii TaxID=330214 RepID=A0ABM8R752_9BACT|nr:hypothetical protein NSPZN2_110031 [Nitrospira defluvii]